jgi:hypothetical protein
MGSVLVKGDNRTCCLFSNGAESGVKRKGQDLHVELMEPDLGYVGAYLLRFYRDGVAAVDHIDVEAKIEGTNGYITFYVESFVPPVTEQEARRRLGL